MRKLRKFINSISFKGRLPHYLHHIMSTTKLKHECRPTVALRRLIILVPDFRVTGCSNTKRLLPLASHCEPEIKIKNRRLNKH